MGVGERQFIVEGYKIFYVETDDDETPTKQYRVDDPYTYEYVIDKTLPTTHFYVYMQAFSGSTLSPYSKRYYCPSKKVAMSSSLTVTPYTNVPAQMSKSTVSDRDKAFLIAGATFAFVALVLAASGICYRKALTNQLKQVECRDGNSRQFHSQICAKVANHIKRSQLAQPPSDLHQQDFDEDDEELYQIPETGQYYMSNANENCNSNHQIYQHITKNLEPVDYLSNGDDQHHCMATGMASLNWSGTMFGASAKDSRKAAKESDALIEQKLQNVND